MKKKAAQLKNKNLAATNFQKPNHAAVKPAPSAVISNCFSVGGNRTAQELQAARQVMPRSHDARAVFFIFNDEVIL